MDYSTQIPVDENGCDVIFAPWLSDVEITVNGNGVQIGADGATVCPIELGAEAAEVEIALARTANGERVESRYLLHLTHQQETVLEVRMPPESALFHIENDITGRVFAGADGLYRLIRGCDYTYTATARGYIAQTGELIADGETMSISIDLAIAEENADIHPDIDSE